MNYFNRFMMSVIVAATAAMAWGAQPLHKDDAMTVKQALGYSTHATMPSVKADMKSRLDALSLAMRRGAPSTVNDLVGRYALTYNDGGNAVTIDLGINEVPGSSDKVMVTFSVMDPAVENDANIEATFDAEARTLSIPYTQLTNRNDGYEEVSLVKLLNQQNPDNPYDLYTRTREPLVLTWDDATATFGCDDYWGGVGVNSAGNFTNGYYWIRQGFTIKYVDCGAIDIEGDEIFSSVLGDVEMIYFDLYESSIYNLDCVLTVTNAMKGEIKLWTIHPDVDEIELNGTYDPVARTLTFPSFRLRWHEGYEEWMTFATAEYNDPENPFNLKHTRNPLVLTWDENEQNGCFVTDQPWGIFGEASNGDIQRGRYALCNQTMLRPIRDWEPLGKGYFTENSAVAPFFNLTIVDQEVEIEKSPYAEGFIHLKSPWYEHFLPMGANITTSLEIDINDPECVVIHKQNTYMFVTGHGWCLLQSASDDYFRAGYTKEEFLADAPERNIALRDNRMDLPIGALQAMYSYHPNGLMWFDESEGGTPGYILMPGYVHNSLINPCFDNTPVEYYNLQGIRVEKPAPGNIYITRQGDTTRKVMFK